MEERILLVCPDCKIFCSDNASSTDYVCPKCGKTMYEVPIWYDMYNDMDEKNKKEFREKYIKKHFTTKKKAIEPFEPMPDSKMAKTIGCMGGVMIALAFVGGAVALITSGILAGIAMLLGGLVSGGILYVLSNVAEDVRHTRNQIDRLMHERKYKR